MGGCLQSHHEGNCCSDPSWLLLDFIARNSGYRSTACLLLVVILGPSASS